MPGFTIHTPSLQSLLIQMKFGDQPLATGTGFICISKKGPVLITNWYNVSGRGLDTKQPISDTGGVPDSVAIMHNKAGWVGSRILKTEPLNTSAGDHRWFEHPQFGDKVDLAALPLTD